MNKIVPAIMSAALIALALTGCTQEDNSVDNDQNTTNSQLQEYQKNQPPPRSDYSQYRQTIIDVEEAQIHGVATTTFFFDQGVTDPLKSCASLGFPIASTAQLTNPQQVIYTGSDGIGTVAQAEPNGVYTGDSSGTYVDCLSSNGTPYISYWEGYVETEGGNAHWDVKSQQIVLDGDPTVTTKDVRNK